MDIREAVKSLNETRRALQALVKRVTLLTFDGYDAVGGTTITGTTSTLNIDTTRKNADTTVFSLGSDVLTIDDSDSYKFTFRVTVEASSDCEVLAWLEQCTDGGSYSEVLGTRCRILGQAV